MLNFSKLWELIPSCHSYPKLLHVAIRHERLWEKEEHWVSQVVVEEHDVARPISFRGRSVWNSRSIWSESSIPLPHLSFLGTSGCVKTPTPLPTIIHTRWNPRTCRCSPNFRPRRIGPSSSLSQQSPHPIQLFHQLCVLGSKMTD